MNKVKRLFCTALILCLAAGATFAEDSSETPEPNTSPIETTVPTEIPTTKPPETPPPTNEPTDEPSEEPVAPPTTEQPENPDVQPTDEPSGEPSDSPTLEPSDSPTPEPSETPAIQPTETPEATSTPTAAPETPMRLKISVVESAEQTEQGYRIPFSLPEDPIAFRWNPLDGIDGYKVEILDEGGNIIYAEFIDDAFLSLPASTFAEGWHVLTVQAIDDGVIIAEDTVSFELVLQDENSNGNPPFGDMPGGFHGGNRPGGFFGGRPSGGFGAGDNGDMANEDQGFRIIPGQALTSSHAPGDGDMQLYGTVTIEVPDAPMTILTLGDEALNIVLDSGTNTFTAAAMESTLVLTPEANGVQWSINGLALKTLRRSGIEWLDLGVGSDFVKIPTQWSFQGAEYARLCAEGYVSKDYTVIVGTDSIWVEVAGEIYRIDDQGELSLIGE